MFKHLCQLGMTLSEVNEAVMKKLLKEEKEDVQRTNVVPIYTLKKGPACPCFSPPANLSPQISRIPPHQP